MNRAMLVQALDAAEKMRSGMIQMRENAERYGEVWAAAHVKEYRELLHGSAEERFRDLNAMQMRMSDFACSVIEGYDAIQALKKELAKPEPEPYGWTVSGICRIYKGDYAEKATKDEASRLGIGYKAIPLYAAPTEPNCKFPTCHSQEYQDKLVQEILGQEPVAYMLTTRNFGLGGETWDTTEYRDYQWDSDCVPLYTKGTPNV